MRGLLLCPRLSNLCGQIFFRKIDTTKAKVPASEPGVGSSVSSRTQIPLPAGSSQMLEHSGEST
jgi:hypothetical protein